MLKTSDNSLKPEIIKETNTSEKKGIWYFVAGGLCFEHSDDCPCRECSRGDRAFKSKARALKRDSTWVSEPYVDRFGITRLKWKKKYAPTN